MNFQTIVAKTGKWTLFVVIILVVTSYWDVINLGAVPIPKFVDWLHLYLLVNGLAATPFVYLEKRAKVRVKRVCPKCEGPLEVMTNYSCPVCGEIRFEKPKLQ